MAFTLFLDMTPEKVNPTRDVLCCRGERARSREKAFCSAINYNTMADLSRPYFQCNGATVAREAIRLESLDDLASPFWFQKSSLPVIFTFSPITLLDQIAGFFDLTLAEMTFQRSRQELNLKYLYKSLYHSNRASPIAPALKRQGSTMEGYRLWEV